MKHLYFAVHHVWGPDPRGLAMEKDCSVHMVETNGAGVNQRRRK